MAPAAAAKFSTSLLFTPPHNYLLKPPSVLPNCIPRTELGRGKFQKSPLQLWRASASAARAEDALPSAAAIEKAQQVVTSAGDDGSGGSTIVSALLFAAFIGLSLLTVGVIYLAVQDFLQKRERDKFEKEEAAKRKKGGKKAKVKARTGPRGFGQKIEEEEED